MKTGWRPTLNGLPVPSLRTQLKLRELHQRVRALKAKHATIRQANTALIPATLERVFQREDTRSSEPISP